MMKFDSLFSSGPSAQGKSPVTPGCCSSGACSLQPQFFHSNVHSPDPSWSGLLSSGLGHFFLTLPCRLSQLSLLSEGCLCSVMLCLRMWLEHVAGPRWKLCPLCKGRGGSPLAEKEEGGRRALMNRYGRWSSLFRGSPALSVLHLPPQFHNNNFCYWRNHDVGTPGHVQGEKKI